MMDTAIAMYLFEQLENAKVFKFFRDTRELHIWKGASGVNVYNLNGDEIDYYSFSEIPKTNEKAKQEIQAHYEASKVD